MKAFMLWCVLLCGSQACLALPPYLQGDKVTGPGLSARLDQVEKKLQAEGFSVVGRHTPPGLPGHASLVVTDPDMLATVRTLGGPAIVAATIRVGLQEDGTLSYMHPEYWYRAYLRGQYPAAQTAAQSVHRRMARALGEGPGFGGDVPEGALANYRYMFGMERFDAANSLLGTHASFEDALKSVQDNLARGVGSTRRVYEVVMPNHRIAVFGVAMNDPDDGEGWWVNKIGAGHMAGLPYELFIVDNKVYALYARYRIALAWPALGMGQFMRIVNAPEAIRSTLSRIAGGSPN